MDIVNVPVPASRLIEVYRLLGASPAVRNRGYGAGSAGLDRRSPGDHTASGERDDPGPGEIPRRTPRRGDHYDAGGRRARTQISGGDSLAGALGAFGRRLGNRGLSFPWVTWYSPDDGKSRMMMEPDIAALILELL